MRAPRTPGGFFVGKGLKFCASCPTGGEPKIGTLHHLRVLTERKDFTVYRSRRQPVGQKRIDGFTRDELCQQYRRRVMLIARRVAERLPPGCELGKDDLASCGAIGLLEAFERFDDDRTVKFSTFAEYRIRGAMMDALRASDAFTRYRRQLSRRMQDSVHVLTGKLGRPPTPQEVADKLEISLEEYWTVMDRVAPVSFMSLDDTESPDGEDSGRAFSEALMSTDGREAFRAIAGVQARDELKRAIVQLGDRKRHCILLYYGRGMNLAEIAEVFEVTPSRISQVLSEARKELREKLRGKVSAGDLMGLKEAL
jgi:RNA polymerase sigma factor for flagellar operon FliA